MSEPFAQLYSNQGLETQVTQYIRRTPFLSSRIETTTLNTQADPTKRATGVIEQLMERVVSEETL